MTDIAKTLRIAAKLLRSHRYLAEADMLEAAALKLEGKDAEGDPLNTGTPRVDAIAHPFRQRNDQTYMALYELARQLELELLALQRKRG